MNEARDTFEHYLSRIGLRVPADAAQQFQVTLMRQWCDHLDEVLEHNLPDPALRSLIIREFLYGVVPVMAEAGLREEMYADTVRLIENAGIPRTGAT
jgi:hypothetical protein